MKLFINHHVQWLCREWSCRKKELKFVSSMIYVISYEYFKQYWRIQFLHSVSWLTVCHYNLWGNWPHSILFSQESVFFLPPHILVVLVLHINIIHALINLNPNAIKCILRLVLHQRGYRCNMPTLYGSSICSCVTFFLSTPS